MRQTLRSFCDAFRVAAIQRVIRRILRQVLRQVLRQNQNLQTSSSTATPLTRSAHYSAIRTAISNVASSLCQQRVDLSCCKQSTFISSLNPRTNYQSVSMWLPSSDRGRSLYFHVPFHAARTTLEGLRHIVILLNETTIVTCHFERFVTLNDLPPMRGR